MSDRLLILTGASGAGKTEVARACANSMSPKLSVFHFDDIGVPCIDEMIRAFGSGEAWQRAKTFEWIACLAKMGRPSMLFEGQMRISFILEALAKYQIETAKILLLDCDEQTRRQRLIEARSQPDLANDQMMQWAEYLRLEAQEHACTILDTSALSVDETCKRVFDHLNP